MKRIVITAAAIALAAAGCGASADNDFKRDFNAAQQPLEKLLADFDAVPTGDANAYSAQMGKLADGLDDTAAALRKLDAPSDAEDEFAAFLKEIDAGADSVRDVQKAVDSGKPARMTKALGEFQTHMTAVDTSQLALEKAVG
jgi:uncharacterized protein Yka (UPF0111/DUF47 family)